MSWYNPSTWFNGESQQITDEIILNCDNPQCKIPIEEGPVAYDQEHREIYHEGDCGPLANAYRARKSGGMEMGNVDHVSIKKALNLFRKGKLNQSRKLEYMVE